MASLKMVNKNAEIARAASALQMNIGAGKGLMDVIKSNLGPTGTLKMLISGGGDIKITKDGNVLLNEMQIQHPTASLIARTATAQDEITGDGTTSNVLIIGECLKQSERFLAEGVHPRILSEGIEIAKNIALKELEAFKVVNKEQDNREMLESVCRTSLRTKLETSLADQLTSIIVDAILTIRRPSKHLDLHMVEILEMQHRSQTDSRLIKGIVLDHGARHPEMPKNVKNAFILTCNVSLEHEKSEQTSVVNYTSAEERQKMIHAERSFVDSRVRQIIELKKQVCTTPDKGFIVINQKGIDPMSLDMLAKEGILALRRAKRRNMERLILACGGEQMNAFENLTAACLGHCGEAYEFSLGEEKYTFIEGVANPESVTLLLKGPNAHAINQIKDAVRDGLRSVKNALEDCAIVPGAGAFEIAAHAAILASPEFHSRHKLGLQVYADALLVIPKTLATNSGFDAQDSVIALQEDYRRGFVVGISVTTGQPIDPIESGILDNYRVKRQILHSSAVLASQLLLVDEVIRAGKVQQKAGQ